MATCDGSGEYYIVIDSDKCNGCGKCVEKCPQKALKLVTEFIDLEDKTVAAIREEHRKKIKYTCDPANLKATRHPAFWLANQKLLVVFGIHVKKRKRLSFYLDRNQE